MMSYKRFVNVKSRDAAFRLVSDELVKLEDCQLLVLKAHLIVGSILFTHIKSRFARRGPLVEADLSFRQLFCLARAFQERESHPWIWEFITKLSRIRNDFSHELRPANDGLIEELCEFARPFLHSRLEGALVPDLKKTLIMAIVSIHNLLPPDSSAKPAPRPRGEGPIRFVLQPPSALAESDPT